MRRPFGWLFGAVVLLGAQLARAECKNDGECAHLGAGATCEENIGTCFYACKPGTVACGGSTRFCIPEGNVCCAPEGFPSTSCPGSHVCCVSPSNELSCGLSAAECNEKFFGEAKKSGCSIGGERAELPVQAELPAGVLALLAVGAGLRRRFSGRPLRSGSAR
jgi:hypothetical protein